MTSAPLATGGEPPLRGRRAVVTGGGRGAGLVIAQALVAAGAHVSIVGRTKATLEAAARDLDGDYHQLDLGDRVATTAFAEQLRQTDFDILVNNAGLAESAPLEKTSDEMWDRTLALDVTAAFLLMRAAVPRFVSRGFGRVINIASNAGLTGYAYTSAYTAAKHALVGLTRAVAMEVATRGDVTVNALCPGFLDTEMTQASIQRIVEKTHRSAEEARDSLARSSPQRRLIAPAEVAHAVVFLCSPLARGIHGQALPIDGGQVMK
jgi:3-hydroxybutyrate dehydrogenase